MIFILVFSAVHNGRDDTNSFGRHINLHLTYSFQQQNNNKGSPIFTPTGKSVRNNVIPT